jgi:protein O-mannosyl-transferase
MEKSGRMKKSQKIEKGNAFKEIKSKQYLSNNSLIGILLTVVVLITFIIYYSNLDDHFVDFDDTRSVCENPLVLSAPSISGMKTVFTMFSADGNYDPLVSLSFMIDYLLYGFNKIHAPSPHLNNPQVEIDIRALAQPDYIGASGYHLTSLILHCLSVILLFFFCYRLSKSVWVGAIVALLFGIHPMHVESVAWVSERKDQLFVLFYYAAMLAYLSYLRSQKFRVGYLILTGFLFLLSLLSKGEAVTLPLVLLLIDYYEGIKINWKVILVKIPFFIMSLGFGIIAMLAEKSINSIENPDVAFPFLDRIIFACYALFTYLWKLIVPIHLSPFYPYPVKTDGTYPLMVYLSPAIILALLGLLIWKCRRNKPVVFGILFFLVNIVLLIQLIPVGDAIVAERYSYLAYTGLFFIGAVLITNYFKDKNTSFFLNKLKPLMAVIFSVYFIFLGYSAYARVGVWQDSRSLWLNAYKTYPEAERVCGNIAEVYLSEFKIDSALIYLNDATMSTSTQAYIVRSSVYMAIGKLDLAFADCNHVLRQSYIPDSSKLFDVYLNRAHIYTMENKLDSAFADCNSALACKGNLANKWLAYQDRGIVLMTAGKLDLALSDFRRTLQANPALSSIYDGVGTIYNMKGMPDSAIANLSKAIQIAPNNGQAYYQLSLAYQQKGNYPQALSDLLIAQKSGINVDEKTIDALRLKVSNQK